MKKLFENISFSKSFSREDMKNAISKVYLSVYDMDRNQIDSWIEEILDKNELFFGERFKEIKNKFKSIYEEKLESGIEKGKLTELEVLILNSDLNNYIGKDFSHMDAEEYFSNKSY